MQLKSFADLTLELPLVSVCLMQTLLSGHTYVWLLFSVVLNLVSPSCQGLSSGKTETGPGGPPRSQNTGCVLVTLLSSLPQGEVKTWAFSPSVSVSVREQGLGESVT